MRCYSYYSLEATQESSLLGKHFVHGVITNKYQQYNITGYMYRVQINTKSTTKSIIDLKCTIQATRKREDNLLSLVRYCPRRSPQ